MRKTFSRIVNEQASFGNNNVVKRVEVQLGNFPFDDQYINDEVTKIVVGPEELEDGAIYYGHFNPDKNERHGFGMQIWIDGSKFVGYWQNDLINGKGRMIHAEGDVYIGDWRNNLAHGKGEYTDSSGMSYVGDWVKDKQQGKGNYVFEYRN